MANLRCLTIKASEPARLADFYRAVFELETVSEGADLIRLSDGVFTLALIKEPDEALIGIHATGFEVDDLESVRQKAEDGGTPSPHSELQVIDPDKNLIDVSSQSFSASPKKTPFPLRHLALFTVDPRRLADFYGATFGLKEVGRTDRGSIFVSDGYFNQALLFQRVREEKNGFNHLGFKIRDVEEIRDRAEKAGVGAAPRVPSAFPSPNSACTIPKATASIFRLKDSCRGSRVEPFETPMFPFRSQRHRRVDPPFSLSPVGGPLLPRLPRSGDTMIDTHAI